MLDVSSSYDVNISVLGDFERLFNHDNSDILLKSSMLRLDLQWIYSALCRGGCRLDFESGPCHCVGTLDQMPPGSLAVIDFAVMALPSEKNGTVIN